ncbi:MAG: hypothetical protein ACLR17_08725 [Enterobacteriaceae bacterium]
MIFPPVAGAGKYQRHRRCAGAEIYSRSRFNDRIFETFGVPLIGQTCAAGVFCRTSPFDVSIALGAKEIAKAMAVKWQSGLNGGMVVANPFEAFAMPEENQRRHQPGGEGGGRAGRWGKGYAVLLARVAADRGTA